MTPWPERSKRQATRLARNAVVAWLMTRAGAAPLLAVLMGVLASGCAIVPEKRKDFGITVTLPFMRMEAGECYFIDDFMPTPDNLVSGRSGGLWLRYYTYRSAVYKVWDEEKVMLAFYSRDNRCWSLFEEYAAGRL